MNYDVLLLSNHKTSSLRHYDVTNTPEIPRKLPQLPPLYHFRKLAWYSLLLYPYYRINNYVPVQLQYVTVNNLVDTGRYRV